MSVFFKGVGQKFRPDAAAVVGNRNSHRALFQRGADAHMAVFGVLARVGQQIEQHLRQLIWRAVHHGQIRRKLQFQQRPVPLKDGGVQSRRLPDDLARWEGAPVLCCIARE